MLKIDEKNATSYIDDLKKILINHIPVEFDDILDNYTIKDINKIILEK